MAYVGSRIAATIAAALVFSLGAPPTHASTGRPFVSAASAAPPVAVVIRIKPNFNFTDDLVRDANGQYRPAEEYGPRTDTFTGVNLFPFFIILLVIGAVVLFIIYINEQDSR